MPAAALPVSPADAPKTSSPKLLPGQADTDSTSAADPMDAFLAEFFPGPFGNAELPDEPDFPMAFMGNHANPLFAPLPDLGFAEAHTGEGVPTTSPRNPLYQPDQEPSSLSFLDDFQMEDLPIDQSELGMAVQDFSLNTAKTVQQSAGQDPASTMTAAEPVRQAAAGQDRPVLSGTSSCHKQHAPADSTLHVQMSDHGVASNRLLLVIVDVLQCLSHVTVPA